MSEAIMIVAQSILRNTDNPPAEIAFLSLILAQAAWNESLGLETPASFFSAITTMEASNPEIWRHFRSPNIQAAISDLIMAKKRLFPHDNREVVSCRMTADGKVRAEWRIVGSA